MKAKTYQFTATIIVYASDEEDAYDELHGYLNDVKLNHIFDCVQVADDGSFICEQCFAEMSEDEELDNDGLCNKCVDNYNGKEDYGNI